MSYFEDYGRLDIARNYLAGRGIAEVAGGFCVGYAPIGGGLSAHLKQLGFDESVQLAAGVARAGQDGRLIDVFRDRGGRGHRRRPHHRRVHRPGSAARQDTEIPQLPCSG